MSSLSFLSQLGWNDVSFHGSKQFETPTLDKLASEGVTFGRGYVNPVCSPTRTSFLSGRSVVHTGVYTPFLVGSLVSLNTTCNRPSSQPCSLLSDQLKTLGE